MAKVTTQNQLHPPLPKKKRVDKNGNSRKRLFVKSGTSTMLLCTDLTKAGCDVFIDSIRTNAEKLGGKIKCDFLITQ